MRLTGIEATRYGALENACLSVLVDGLTVVLGPNESGKSTFTALTRHVLFGFPDARTRERGYVPLTGNRAGRLVFGGQEGEWAIERVEGPRRGTIAVQTRRGADRPGLLDEVIGGVSEQTFRVVLGFGLDELAQIESGDDAAVMSRLYSAGVGLAVNPMDVRKALDDRAAEQYAPRARKATLNALASRITELKARIRTLESEAAGLAGQQQELHGLEERLAQAREQRDALGNEAVALAKDAQRLGDAWAQREEATAEVTALELGVHELERSLDLIDVDQRVLDAAPALTAVLEDQSGFRTRLEALEAAENRVDEATQRLKAGREVPETIADSPEDRAAIEPWRVKLADAQRMLDDRTREAERVRVTAEQSERVFTETRSEAGGGSRSRLGWAAAAMVVGAVGVAAAALTGQWIAAGLGAVFAVVGVALLVTRAKPAGGELDTDLARQKADVAAKEELVAVAQRDLEQLQVEWRAWLAERDADAWGEDPVAVRELLATVQERAKLQAELDGHRRAAQRERDAAEAWVTRLVEVVSAFDAAGAEVPMLSGAGEMAAHARATLDRELKAEAERTELGRKLAESRSALTAVTTRRDQFAQTIAEVVQARDLDAADPVSAIRDLAAEQNERLAQVREDHDALAAQVAALRERLDEDGRSDETALVRQQLEGARADAQAALASYAVHRIAVSLIDSTREQYERERQGPVVEAASRVFSAMTEGRYTRVHAPLDNSGIAVFTASGERKTTAELSRGTAEQLYLALRVGLIGSLGEMGRMLPVLMDDVVVNFDPERRAGSVAAVRELASVRQVVYFTCHPEMAQLLVDGVEGSALVTLDRCAMAE